MLFNFYIFISYIRLFIFIFLFFIAGNGVELDSGAVFTLITPRFKPCRFSGSFCSKLLMDA